MNRRTRSRAHWLLVACAALASVAARAQDPPLPPPVSGAAPAAAAAPAPDASVPAAPAAAAPAAEDPAPQPAAPEAVAGPVAVPASPRLFGLDLEPGPLAAGDGRCVLTCDAQGAAVVARVQLRVGANLVVMLPDGQLAARAAGDCSDTQRSFQPATPEQLIEGLAASGFINWRHKRTHRYLYLFNGSEAFAETTSGVLESMFRGVVNYALAQKIEVHPPETPLVVVIFRTLKQFREHRSVPAGVIAYYDVVSNRILMCEESDLWSVKPELAIGQTIATISHEGAHQILHNIGVQQRLSLWPMWLNEGLAEFFAPTFTDQRLKWKGAGEVNDLRMFELEQLIKSLSPETADGQVVAQTVGAARLTSTGYATAWALTHYLAKNQREDFHAFVRETSRRGPLETFGETISPGIIPSNLRDFKRHFGSDLAGIERRLALHLRRLPYRDPFADWPHFVAFVTIFKDGKRSRQANVFHRREQAERWRQERLDPAVSDPQDAAASGVREFANRLEAERHAQQWVQGQ